jgi:hypothetical protein
MASVRDVPGESEAYTPGARGKLQPSLEYDDDGR